MTLVELLVVVAIVVMLAAATIPRLKPNIDRARVREAARSIQLYLSSARNQAIANGRSCGVMIERLPAQTGCSVSLTQVETPLPYGGDFANSTAKVVANSPAGGLAQCTITLSSAPSVPLYQGDQIQVGYQGFWITLDQRNAVNSSGAITNPQTLTGYVDTSHGETPAWLVQPVVGPYKIIRWPNKSATDALQLPSPACIDLTQSGFYDPTNPIWPSSTQPVTIMFAPNGTVDRIYVTSASGAYAGQRVTEPICLLVGSIDGVTGTPSNLSIIYNLWVAINPSTGLIIVTDMASSTDPYSSRQYAAESSAMGGK